jgi:hypothetical protein
MKHFTTYFIPTFFWLVLVIQLNDFNEVAMRVWLATIITVCLGVVGSQIGKYIE